MEVGLIEIREEMLVDLAVAQRHRRGTSEGVEAIFAEVEGVRANIDDGIRRWRATSILDQRKRENMRRTVVLDAPYGLLGEDRTVDCADRAEDPLHGFARRQILPITLFCGGVGRSDGRPIRGIIDGCPPDTIDDALIRAVPRIADHDEVTNDGDVARSRPGSSEIRKFARRAEDVGLGMIGVAVDSDDALAVLGKIDMVVGGDGHRGGGLRYFVENCRPRIVEEEVIDVGGEGVDVTVVVTERRATLYPVGHRRAQLGECCEGTVARFAVGLGRPRQDVAGDGDASVLVIGLIG